MAKDTIFVPIRFRSRPKNELREWLAQEHDVDLDEFSDVKFRMHGNAVWYDPFGPDEDTLYVVKYCAVESPKTDNWW